MDVIHERCAGIDISKADVKVVCGCPVLAGAVAGRCARSRP
jgi:hypothetical protein